MSNITLEIWYRALSSEHGVLVETTDPGRAKQVLYKLRREANDDSLYLLSIVESPTNPEKDLWIVRGKGNAKKSPV